MALIAQDARQEMLAAERSYAKASETIGLKQAALQFFAKDTVIFQPDAVNGKEFWVSQPDGPTIAVRSVVSSDISATGFIGYTTGSIEIFPKGKTDTDTQFGNYVTIWGRREGNTFRPIVEITTRHVQIDLMLPFYARSVIREISCIRDIPHKLRFCGSANWRHINRLTDYSTITSGCIFGEANRWHKRCF